MWPIWSHLYQFPSTMTISIARQSRAKFNERERDRLIKTIMIFQASKILKAYWWSETQISTDTDRKANLTWTLYILPGSSLLMKQQAPLSSEDSKGHSKDNGEGIKKGRGYMCRKPRLNNFTSHIIKIPIYNTNSQPKK